VTQKGADDQNTIFHETQHLVDEIEGRVSGADPSVAVQQAAAKYDSVIKELTDQRRALQNKLNNKATPLDPVDEFVMERELNNVSDQLADMTARRDAILAAKGDKIGKYVNYITNLGEGRARQTQDDVGLDDIARRNRLAYQNMTRDQVTRTPDGDIEVSRGHPLRSYETWGQDAPTERAGEYRYNYPSEGALAKVKQYGLPAASMLTASALSEAQPIPPEVAPTVGAIHPAKHPMLSQIANALRSVETPFGPAFQSIPNILERWSYGEDSDHIDKFLAPLEIMP
jgi:hypothetical protein